MFRTFSRSTFLLVAPLLSLAGCQSTPPSSGAAYSVTACSSSGDCAEGTCVRDLCLTPCAADADCPAGAVCLDGSCFAGSTSASCAADADCRGGEACVSGRCAELPDLRACTADSDCPSGAACVSGACVSRCVPSAEVCGNGIDDDCDGVVDDGCAPTACRTDSECASGEACVGGVCTARPAACTTDADCARGEVCASGVCTASTSCVPHAEICGNGIDDDCNGVIDDGCSTPACRTDADCAVGQRCTAGVCTAA